MIQKQYIPFGKTGNLCIVVEPLKLNGSLSLSEYSIKIARELENDNIKKIILFSTVHKPDYYEDAIESFSSSGISTRFLEYPGSNENRFEEDVELIQLIQKTIQKSNFCFYCTEDEFRELYIFIAKALLYLVPGTNTFDVATYFKNWHWQKDELKHISSYLNFLRKDFLLFREKNKFQPKPRELPLPNKTATIKLKMDSNSTGEVINLIFAPLSGKSDDASLLQNDDGSYKPIDFELSSLTDVNVDNLDESLKKPDSFLEEIPENLGAAIHLGETDPKVTVPNSVTTEESLLIDKPVVENTIGTDSNSLQSEVNQEISIPTEEPVSSVDTIYIDLEELGAPEETNPYIREFRNKDISGLIHTINQDIIDLEDESLTSSIDDIIDFSLEDEPSPTQQPDRVEPKEEAVAPKEPVIEEKKSLVNIELIDMDSLIDDELEKGILHSEPEMVTISEAQTNPLIESTELPSIHNESDKQPIHSPEVMVAQNPIEQETPTKTVEPEETNLSIQNNSIGSLIEDMDFPLEFAIDSLITEELESEDGMDELPNPADTSPKISPVLTSQLPVIQDISEVEFIDSENIVSIESLIPDGLEPELSDMDIDFLIDPIEKNIDKLIHKEIES